MQSKPLSSVKVRAVTLGLNGLTLNEPGATFVNKLSGFMAPGVQLPSVGTTLLYGSRYSSKLISHIFQHAQVSDLDFEILNLSVQVGQVSQKTLTLEGAAHQKFLPTTYRLRASAMDEINTRWNQLLEKRGLASERFPRKPSDNMHLLDELVEKEPFSGMTGISYVVRTIAGPAQLLTVLDPEAIGPDARYPNLPTPESGVVVEVPQF